MKAGLKYDDNKTEWGLLPWAPLEDVVKVLMFGANKYEKDSWQQVEPKERYVNAAFRHLIAHQNGEELDQESGLPHLAHAVCCCLFKMWGDSQEADDLSNK